MLTDPVDRRFASAARLGAWSAGVGVCPECRNSSQQRIRPLILEWEPGSDLVGDFTWPGFGSDIAMTDRVLTALRCFHGFEPGAVEMLQDSALKEPRGSRAQPRVWLPYHGPPLHDLSVTSRVHVDLQKSSVRLVRDCGTCSRRQYAAEGIESSKTRWDKERRAPVKAHTARKPGCGIYVSDEALEGAAIFRTYEFPAWVLCTDPVKSLIEEAGLTNVAFLEMGETFSMT